MADQQVTPEEQQFLQQSMTNPNVIKQLEGMPPEERAAFMRKMYQDYTGQEAINTEAMSQADLLRSGGTPQGVHAGQQYVAASPLSHIAKGMNQYSGTRDYKAAQDEIAARSKDKSDVLAQFAAMQAGMGGSKEQLMANKLRINGLGGR
jgi:hypothetical protein